MEDVVRRGIEAENRCKGTRGIEVLKYLELTTPPQRAHQAARKTEGNACTSHQGIEQGSVYSNKGLHWPAIKQVFIGRIIGFGFRHKVINKLTHRHRV